MEVRFTIAEKDKYNISIKTEDRLVTTTAVLNGNYRYFEVTLFNSSELEILELLSKLVNVKREIEQKRVRVEKTEEKEEPF